MTTKLVVAILLLALESDAALTIVQTTPADNATNVPLVSPIDFVCNFPIIIPPTPVRLRLYETTDGVQTLVATFAAHHGILNGPRWSRFPYQFTVDTAYHFEMDAAFVASPILGPLPAITDAVTWNFHTVPVGFMPFGQFPLHGSSGVPMDLSARLVFNVPIQAGTGQMRIHKVDDIHGPISINHPNALIGGTVLTVPLPTLEPLTDYYITMDSGFVKSVVGGKPFSGFSGSTMWTFTTGNAPAHLAEETIVTEGEHNYVANGLANPKAQVYVKRADWQVVVAGIVGFCIGAAGVVVGIHHMKRKARQLAEQSKRAKTSRVAGKSYSARPQKSSGNDTADHPVNTELLAAPASCDTKDIGEVNL